MAIVTLAASAATQSAAAADALVQFGAGAVVLPAAQFSATGHNSTGEKSFVYELPVPSLSAYGGASAALAAPMPTISLTGAFTGWGDADITAPSPALSATGTVSGQGMAALTFGTTSDTYKIVGYSGAVVSITLPGHPTVAATGTTGGTGNASLTLPLFDVLVATGTVHALSYANITAPAAMMGGQAQAWLLSPMATLVAVGTAVVAVTYEAYAANLNHTPQRGVEPVDELTRYTNYPFDRIVRYKNSYYGMNSTGLYLLEGTTDAGTATPWAVKTAESDFKSEQLKTIEMAYFGGRMAPASTVSLFVGEGAAQPYAYTTPRGELAQNYRQPFGRGLKSRYFALGLAGSGTLSIDSVTLNVTTLARKV